MFRRVAEYAFEYAKNNGRSKVIQFLNYFIQLTSFGHFTYLEY